MVDLVNMDVDSDLDGQFDSDEEEDIDEDSMLRVVAAVTNFAFFAAVCCLQICFRLRSIEFPWHTITWPIITMNTHSSLLTSDNDVHPRQKAHWTSFEEVVLIQFLLERKNQMTWRSMFNDIVFKQAAKAVNRFHEKGARKTSISCRSKWTRVRTVFFLVRALTCYPDFV